MNKAILFSIFIIVLCSPCFAQYGNETITITTYYPSPHGVYGVLTLYPRDSLPDLETTREGDLYYDNGTEDPTNRSKGVYVYNGSNWTLTNLGGGASSGDALVRSEHTKSDCTNHVLRGEVVDTDVGFQQCRFGTATNPVSACPSGWTQFKNYHTTPYGKAWGGDCRHGRCPCDLSGVDLDKEAVNQNHAQDCDEMTPLGMSKWNLCNPFTALPWGDYPFRTHTVTMCCSWYSTGGQCESWGASTWRERAGETPIQVGCY